MVAKPPDFQTVTAACIRLYLLHSRGAALDADLQARAEALERLLGRIWGNVARIYAARTEGWVHDRELLGYLVRETSTTAVRVPYHLAPDFPVGAKLEELTGLALRIRASDDGTVCISGSSTFWESLGAVNDVDFCEYIPLAGASARAAVRERLAEVGQGSSASLACLNVKAYCSKGKSLPLAHADASRELFRAKLDFVALLLDDVVEATNVVLPVQTGDHRDPALKCSYAFQEAPIGAESWVPQKLLNPVALGEYAQWLMKKVTELMADNPIKAAKRGLSLARITGHNDFGGRLIGLMRTGTGVLRAALDARMDLRTRIDALGHCGRQ
jgi:hypothetical protein